MSNLARRTAASGSGSRVLLVRQPVRSVRAAHDSSKLPVHLAIGVIVGVGVVATLWLIGYLGFHLGFAPTVGVHDLQTTRGGSLIVGVLMVMSIPMTILRTGIAQPMWLMLGFVAIAIPAGALAGVKPASPGGPRPHVLTVVFAYVSAIGACVFALLAIWWVLSPARSQLLAALPSHADGTTQWLADLRLAAGLDVLATVAIALWVVLVMRLTIPTWLRGLAAGFSFTALAVVIAALAVSNVTVSQVTSSRTVAVAFEGATADQVLLLGEAFDQLATLRVTGGHISVEIIEHPSRLRIVDHQSIASFTTPEVTQDY